MTAILIVLFPWFITQGIAPADTTIVAPEDINQTYQSFLANDSLTYEEKFNLARQLARNNQWPEAIEVYTSILSTHPDDPDSRLGRGLVYAWQGRYAEAEADLLQVTKKAPTYADAWMALGNVYLWWNFPAKAIISYSEWADLQPDSPLPYFSRAKAFRALRNFSQARSDLFQARRLGGDQDAIDQLLREMDRIPGVRPWESMILLEYDTFSGDRLDWYSATFSVKRELSVGSFSLGLIQAHRYNQTDKALLIDSYWNLWRRAYGNFSLKLVPDRNVLPGSDATLEIYHGIGNGWEISGRYRRMAYPLQIVQLYGTTLARYLGQWYLRSVVQYVPKDGGADLFGIATARRYLSTVDDFIELGVGFGTEFETGETGPLYTTSEVYSARAQRFFTPRLGIIINATFHRTSTYERWSFAAGLNTRW